jgi:uncharacterized DUF497 family protein
MARLHSKFEWDESKAESNVRKHSVTFKQAAVALKDEDGDQFHLDVDDPSHSVGEDRFVTYATLPARRSILLVITWTDRSTDDERITRIISARLATKQEKAHYVRTIGG